MRCPQCGTKALRYAHDCARCGAPLPKKASAVRGPGVVGASEAQTRWFAGPVLATVIVIVAIVMAVLMVILYHSEAREPTPGATSAHAVACPASVLGRVSSGKPAG